MTKRTNLLLGNGHRLTSPVKIGKAMETKPPPYDLNESKKRFESQLAKAINDFELLPEKASPDGYVVGLLTLHPEYIAKSYYPADLLREANMEAIGSRPTKIKPDKWKKKGDPEESTSTQLFVAARKKDLDDLLKQTPVFSESDRASNDLFKVEAFRAPDTSDRVQRIRKDAGSEPLLEVVLHTNGLPRPSRILESFEDFADSLDLSPDMDRRFEVSGLCFLPMRADRSQLEQLSKFAFLRTIREMPGLRPLRPIIRKTAKTKPFPVSIPDVEPLDKQLRAAVFDGGISDALDQTKFANLHEPEGIDDSIEDYVDHGTGVSSAVLFGPLAKGIELPQPFGTVDHYRVLDSNSANDPYELYDTLKRIQDVLQSRKYEFINFSIGPFLPVEDYEVHAWTAVLDSLLSNGNALTTVAVGNEGEKDHASGNARVQVPSDSVNSLAVGAADSAASVWKRATYSCIGPGRSPGVIKPEVIAFGGSSSEPFFVLDQTLSIATPEAGTSFAAPYALRMGMGVRAHFGTSLSPLAIKALLVHCTQQNKKLPVFEVGWGRIAQSIDEIVLTSDTEARIVYQGELTPGQYLRTPIPLPSKKLEGKVSIKATFCIACETDANDPSNYTRGGLDITFRPNAEKFKPESAVAATQSFFRRTDYDSEKELRRDAHKWETTLHHSKGFQSATLRDPVFDVHYQAREAGHSTRADTIHYALVITISAPKVSELYDGIVQRYQTQLEPIQPVIEIPIQV